jgi:hypothetical protein
MPDDAWDWLATATGFDWDEGNATKNWAGHAVSQVECEEVFFNSPLLALPDPRHSASELRYYVLGQTTAGRRLFLVFTPRGTLIRIISARDMSRRERRVYTNAEAREEPEA